jgi:hypothetical protein
MIKSRQFEIVKELPFDENVSVFKKGDTELFLLRPSKLSKRFKKYDVKKNFQIWLIESDRRFRPNHLRLMIDLNLRVRSQPEKKRDLLLSFDNIFYGADPVTELKDLSKVNFEHFLNDIQIIGVLAQLFVIEQEYCYTGESNFDPPTLFFQGWVRQFIDSPREIDNLCMSVSNRQPPQVKYTKKENRKHKEFQENLPDLWYIEEGEKEDSLIDYF